MIIGEISKGEELVKFHLDIQCTDCGRKVPGGLQASEKFYGTESFRIELADFKRDYLCGVCRDRNRVKKSNTL